MSIFQSQQTKDCIQENGFANSLEAIYILITKSYLPTFNFPGETN